MRGKSMVVLISACTSKLGQSAQGNNER